MLIYNNKTRNNMISSPATVKKTTSKHKLTATNISFLKTLGLKIKKQNG